MIDDPLRQVVERNPLVPGRGTISGRAVLEGKTIHIRDVLVDRYDKQLYRERNWIERVIGHLKINRALRPAMTNSLRRSWEC